MKAKIDSSSKLLSSSFHSKKNKEKSIDLKRHVKIWFSRNPDVPLGEELNEQRLLSILNKNPLNTVCLIIDKSLLSDKGLQRLKDLFGDYSDRMRILDVNELQPLLDEREQKLFTIVKNELNHEFGNLAAASDIVRWFKPVLEQGVYWDFDIDLNYNTYAVNCCVQGDFDEAIARMEKHLTQNPQHAFVLLVDFQIMSKESIASLKEFAQRNPSQVRLRALICSITTFASSRDLRNLVYNCTKNQENLTKNLELLEKFISNNPSIRSLGLPVNLMKPFPIIHDGLVRGTDFILPIEHTDYPISCANNIVGFYNTSHPLISIVQEMTLSGYELIDGKIKFFCREHEEKYGPMAFKNVFDFRKHLISSGAIKDYEFDLILRSGNTTDALKEYYKSTPVPGGFDLHNILSIVGVSMEYERSWLKKENLTRHQLVNSEKETIPSLSSNKRNASDFIIELKEALNSLKLESQGAIGFWEAPKTVQNAEVESIEKLIKATEDIILQDSDLNSTTDISFDSQDKERLLDNKLIRSIIEKFQVIFNIIISYYDKNNSSEDSFRNQ